ncbi:MAG: hypothetical protein DWQ09_08375 [Proteobacteria bacterium]|nr:MAG: hypothetical protein DWQ09_08375 [Pseudomonadota bacterium]
MNRARLFLFGGMTLAVAALPAHGAEWYGNVTAQSRLFDKTSSSADQKRSYTSLSFESTFYHQSNSGRDLFAVTPFVRVDEHDAERTHADLRELTWVRVNDDSEWRLGLRKVFWGMTEGVHLVDVINQTDLVENVDGEDKLGQPMINLSLVREWGIVDLFILPYFRERTFPASDGRPRTVLPVATELAQYESSDQENHVDYAIRWVHSIGDWDVGLSWFKGTNRDPLLQPGLNGAGQPVLVPLYKQMEQFGVDLQATKGDWLWKLEVIDRDTRSTHYTAAAGGFEYTFIGLFDTQADLGVIAEYLYDERGVSAPTPTQDDILIGLRWTLNDTQSTEALVGVILDRGSDARMLSLEASRRLGQDWKVALEARWFTDQPTGDPLYPNRDDDFVQVELSRYF